MKKRRMRIAKGVFPKASFESMRHALIKMEPGKRYTVNELRKLLGVGTANRVIDIMSTPKILGFVKRAEGRGYILTEEGIKLRELLRRNDETGVKRMLREAIKRSDFYSFIESLRKKDVSLDEMVKETMEKYNYKTKDIKGFKYRVVGAARKLCAYAYEGIEVKVERKEHLYYMLGKMAGLVLKTGKDMETKATLEEFEKLLYNLPVEDILLKLFEKEKKVILKRDDLSLLEPFLEVLEEELMK